jgi:hypothetical protein
MTKRDLVMNKIYQGFIKSCERELLEDGTIELIEDGEIQMPVGSTTITAWLHQGEVQKISLAYPDNESHSAAANENLCDVFKEAVDKAIHHVKATNLHGGSYAIH